MSKGGDDHPLGSGEGYCSRCEEVRTRIKTVPWQRDLCAVCSADIED